MAGREDLPGLLELYRQLTPEDPLLDAPKAQSIWEAIEANDDLRYFVATDGQKLVSTCNIWDSAEPPRSGST